MALFFVVAGLLHATLLAVIGFFVLFAASKATGAVKRIGEVLGIWLYILAVLAIIASSVWGPAMWRAHGGYHAWGAHPGQPAATAAPANTAAAK
jgi:hypothetical protein